MRNAPLILLFILVFLPSLAVRLYPVESESFQHDAIVSQTAAREGIIVNAWDSGGVYEQRRYHPPLLSYIILINNKIFGSDDFHARLYSIVMGALACFLAALAIYRLTGARLIDPARDDPSGPPGGGRSRWMGGAFGGWLLCLLPVHLYVSRTANWDAVYSLLSVSTLYCLSKYLLAPRLRTLAAAGVFGLLGFLTCEVGLSLVSAFAAVLFFDLSRAGGSTTLRRWAKVLLVVLVLLLVLWPAGLFKLDLLRTLRFRLYDSSVITRKLPWYAFYTTLAEQSWAYAVTIVVGVAAFVTVWLRRRFKVDARRRHVAVYLISMLPFLVYVLTAFVLSFKQRLVFVHHIVDMIAPLTVLAVSALVVLTSSLKTSGKSAAAGLAVIVVAFSALAAANRDPNVVGPQEHPGMRGVSAFLEKYPESRTYYYYAYAMAYYAPEAHVDGGEGRFWATVKIAELKTKDYDFIISDRSMLEKNYPSADAVSAVLNPEYKLAHTVRHLRTDEPVVWIFVRSKKAGE